jgi:hypothetical protein
LCVAHWSSADFSFHSQAEESRGSSQESFEKIQEFQLIESFPAFKKRKQHLKSHPIQSVDEKNWERVILIEINEMISRKIRFVLKNDAIFRRLRMPYFHRHVK